MARHNRYIDENGYERGKIRHSDLIHRQIAYREIYLKNKENYPLSFSEYEVHHKDRNKRNNKISNLQILTPEEHEAIHRISRSSEGNSFGFDIRDFMLEIIKKLFIFLIGVSGFIGIILSPVVLLGWGTWQGITVLISGFVLFFIARWMANNFIL